MIKHNLICFNNQSKFIQKNLTQNVVNVKMNTLIKIFVLVIIQMGDDN